MYLTHITTEGERWDQLATRYYGDPLQYERIVAANHRLSDFWEWHSECLGKHLRAIESAQSRPG